MSLTLKSFHNSNEVLLLFSWIHWRFVEFNSQDEHVCFHCGELLQAIGNTACIPDPFCENKNTRCTPPFQSESKVSKPPDSVKLGCELLWQKNQPQESHVDPLNVGYRMQSHWNLWWLICHFQSRAGWVSACSYFCDHHPRLKSHSLLFFLRCLTEPEN